MSDNLSQKSSDEPRIKISREDLFTYFLQKNLWVKMYFEEFVAMMKKQGVEII